MEGTPLRRITEMKTELLSQIKFDGDGLVPCIVQQWDSGEVLMLAFMNREALEKTIDTGETHFWSRSRKALWHKGETSGNTQILRELRYDCDEDALLVMVESKGPACHTGERSCFFRSAGEGRNVSTHEVIPELSRILESRHREMPEGSYTAELLRAGCDMIAEKVEEEAEEVGRAAKEESDQRVYEETADLLYHLGVLLEQRGLSFSGALGELATRMKE